jgi:hypothetical protein
MHSIELVHYQISTGLECGAPCEPRDAVRVASYRSQIGGIYGEHGELGAQSFATVGLIGWTEGSESTQI